MKSDFFLNGLSLVFFLSQLSFSCSKRTKVVTVSLGTNLLYLSFLFNFALQMTDSSDLIY